MPIFDKCTMNVQRILDLFETVASIENSVIPRLCSNFLT